MENMASSLAGLPSFLAYFGVSIFLLVTFSLIYSKMTPHNEWQLIRDNNTAAAIAFSGTLLGFVLPLYSAISHSVNLIDCAIWGLVALIVQVLTFFSIRILIPNLAERIRQGETASGALVAALSVAAGILNAASMTY